MQRSSAPFAVVALFALTAGAVAIAPNQPSLIVEKSLAVNNRDWNAQDMFSYDERDVHSSVDSDGRVQTAGAKTYQVLMIEGSPYRKLIAVNNDPLSPADQAAEDAKLQRETARRRAESPSDRKKRIGKYQDQRAEEHLLMQQMAKAFRFQLIAEERVNGVPCFRLSASPREDYLPPVEKARVLTGMRGTLWIDKADYHWVKVQAQVTQPVSFGFFIAKVNPGTSFELDQMPVDSYWMPRRFVQKVNASVFGLYGYRTQDESFYSAYEPIAETAALK